MVEELIKKIVTGDNVRQSLSALRQEIKEEPAKRRLKSIVGEYEGELIALLNHEDAKTRKNAALLMGDLEKDIFLKPLYEGYVQEQQLFVKSAYLTALQSYDCSRYIEELKQKIEELSGIELTDQNRKHIQEELRALSKLVIQEEGIDTHTFTGYYHPLDCILLTNRLHKELTEEQITDGEIIPFQAGVRVVTERLTSILDIRTYSELLIVVPGLGVVSENPTEAAKVIANSNLLMLLRSTHKEKTPFYFRIEMKSKMQLDKKSAYTKRLASELEKLSKRQLINATSSYEVELRLIENKMGTYNVLLKLGTLPDRRFTYRTESVAASIRPTNAAQLVALAKDYMVEDSRTLDPFCGVGTMLIERQKVVKGNTSYGIDFYAPAIEKAKINTENAGQIIHFVNRNFFDFEHEYKFDEIFTNMPFATGHKSDDEIQELYEEFFSKAEEVLEPEGTMILYSHNPEWIQYYQDKYRYSIIKKIEISIKECTWLYILKFR